MFKKIDYETKILYYGSGRKPAAETTTKYKYNTKKPSGSQSDGRTLGIKDVNFYKAGMWTMALVSSAIGLISNIKTASELANEDHSKPYNNYGGNYNNSSSYKERQYSVTANRMQPFLRANADPRKTTISFGMPWFF